MLLGQINQSKNTSCEIGRRWLSSVLSWGAHMYVRDGGSTYNDMAMKTSSITVMLRLTVKCHMAHICTMDLLNTRFEIIFISMTFD